MARAILKHLFPGSLARGGAVGATLLFLGACGSSASKGLTCGSNADCAQDQFCNPSHFCQIAPGCISDADCPSGQACNTSTGVCQCSADAGCPLGQVCSAALQCETPATCNFNPDCQSGFFCDTASHRCIANGTCDQNIHCRAGYICQNGSCVAGCITDADCPLSDFQTDPPHLVPYACLNGQCVENGCNTSADCPAFYSCGANSQCQSVCQTTPFCSSCDPEDAFFGETPCGNAANLCLDDPRNATDCGTTTSDAGCLFFCGLDCSAGQPCPQGSECTDVTAVNPDGIGGPGEACRAGSTCPTPRGSIRCPAEEGATLGTCPCFSDNDCPLNDFGVPIHCDVASGSCLIGQQCAPTKQYTCQTNGCGGG